MGSRRQELPDIHDENVPPGSPRPRAPAAVAPATPAQRPYGLYFVGDEIIVYVPTFILQQQELFNADIRSADDLMYAAVNIHLHIHCHKLISNIPELNVGPRDIIRQMATNSILYQVPGGEKEAFIENHCRTNAISDELVELIMSKKREIADFMIVQEPITYANMQRDIDQIKTRFNVPYNHFDEEPVVGPRRQQRRRRRQHNWSNRRRQSRRRRESSGNT